MNLRLEYDSFQDFANRLWPCLSEEGMWVRSDNSASVGEVIDFEVALADGFRLFHGTGQVIAVGPGPRDGDRGEGMTVRFSQLDQPSRNLVRKVVSKHIGEGGRLFVLAAPATKVEVVGGDDVGTAGAEAAGTMGPEDLVAPFADLDQDSTWSEESEPELTSFLRPRGRPTETAPEEDVVVEDLAGAASGTLPKIPSSEADRAAAESLVEDRLWEEIPEDLGEATAGGVSSEAFAVAPPVESAESLFLDLGDEVPPPSEGETQRIEPATEELESRAEFSFDEEVEPVHSTVIPPALTSLEHYEGVGLETDEPSTDEFLIGDETPRTARWPWVVIGGLVLGAALFAVLQMDTPLSQWFGTKAATPPVASERQAAAQPATPRLPRPAAPTAESQPTAAEEGAAVPDEAAADSPTVEGLATDAQDAALAPAEEASEPVAAEVPPVVAVQAPEPDSVAAEPAPIAAAEVPATTLPPLRLRRVTWRQEEGDTVVRLALEGLPTGDRFETLRVAGENPRLVLKIDGVAGSVPRQPVAIGSADVRQLRFGVHDVDGVRQVHVVADLAAEGVQMIGPVVVDSSGVELRFGQP